VRFGLRGLILVASPELLSVKCSYSPLEAGGPEICGDEIAGDGSNSDCGVSGDSGFSSLFLADEPSLLAGGLLITLTRLLNSSLAIYSNSGMNPLFLIRREILFSSGRDGRPRCPQLRSTKCPCFFAKKSIKSG
jgi:hypothetical protein